MNEKTCETKTFNNTNFGYAGIIIERPLRLNYIINEERVKNKTAFKNLSTYRKKGRSL